MKLFTSIILLLALSGCATAQVPQSQEQAERSDLPKVSPSVTEIKKPAFDPSQPYEVVSESTVPEMQLRESGCWCEGVWQERQDGWAMCPGKIRCLNAYTCSYRE